MESVEKLQRILCKKIHKELMEFKKEMIRAKNSTVIENAYVIVCMINIYEELQEMTEEMSPENLRALIDTPDLLKFFYSGWLETENSFAREIRESIQDQIHIAREFERRKQYGYAKVSSY
jgi:hypothetical protein